VADLRAGVEQVLHRADGRKVGVLGFCFGGGMVWSLLAGGEMRVAAAAPFYGPLPEGADLSRAKAAVLAVYAENDTRVNDTRPAAVTALEAAKLTHEVVIEPETGHAFFNDTRPDRYNAAAAADAYNRLLSWFGRHLS
jgi:carboxymethylenebutenolidase